MQDTSDRARTRPKDWTKVYQTRTERKVRARVPKLTNIITLVMSVY